MFTDIQILHGKVSGDIATPEEESSTCRHEGPERAAWQRQEGVIGLGSLRSYGQQLQLRQTKDNWAWIRLRTQRHAGNRLRMQASQHVEI